MCKILNNLTRQQWAEMLRNEFTNDIMYQKDMDLAYHYYLKGKQMKTIIGIGHKARQGKDYLARLISELASNVHIVHWADALYEEVRNEKLNMICPTPLIECHEGLYTIYPENDSNYYQYYPGDVPLLHKIFTERKINKYWGTREKDSLMLQFWGTDYRRKYFGHDYWVKKGLEKINSIQDGIILIPDTRFKNEADAIKVLGGIYIDVQRFNEDGSKYVASDRDPNHPSEIDLDDYKADFTVIANSGDLDKLKVAAYNILYDFVPTTQTC